MRKCPRCDEFKMNDIIIRNVISRRDNITYICSDCGVAEALIDTGIISNSEEFKREEKFKKYIGV